MAHPTPNLIRIYISRAIKRDRDENEYTDERPIPARVGRLIDNAISAACEEADSTQGRA